MKRILILSLLLLPAFLPAQITKIKGTASGAEGRTIEIMTQADLLTGIEISLGSDTIGPEGNFEVSFPADRIISIVVVIDFHRGEMFIEPGRNYTLTVTSPESDASREVSPFLESQSLEITISEMNNCDLNALIQSFNREYNEFVLEHFNHLYHDKEKWRLDTFRLVMARKFSGDTGSYFRNYIRYKTASLEQVANILGKAPTVKRYFSDSPVLYDNVEYMDFFKEFFSGYLTRISRPLKFLDYNGMLNGPDSYSVLMKSLASDTLLRKRQFRELVLLRGMMEMYGDVQYPKERILDLLREISVKSEFPGNRTIAGDIVKMMTRLQPGMEAPGIDLTGRDGKKTSLKSFRGKPVVVGFWTTYCTECLAELESLKPIAEKYGDRVNFVTISADREFLKMELFLKLKKDFRWTFLHLGNDLSPLKDYDVRSFPWFVLIDCQGRIVECPSGSPGNTLGSSLEKLLNP